MFKWLEKWKENRRQGEINRLLIQVANDRAYLKAADECGKVCFYTAGQLAANEARLRQLGYKEQDNG